MRGCVGRSVRGCSRESGKAAPGPGAPGSLLGGCARDFLGANPGELWRSVIKGLSRAAAESLEVGSSRVTLPVGD